MHFCVADAEGFDVDCDVTGEWEGLSDGDEVIGGWRAGVGED